MQICKRPLAFPVRSNRASSYRLFFYLLLFQFILFASSYDACMAHAAAPGSSEVSKSVATSGTIQDAETAGNIIEYEVDGREVRFETDNGHLVSLAVLGSDIVRVRIDSEGKPVRQRPSFAVINETFEGVTEINLEETPQGYAVYTGSLIIRVNARPFRISFYDAYQRLLLDDYKDRGYVRYDPGNPGAVDESNASSASRMTGKASYKTLRSNENFYGLGEKGGPLNRRGHAFRMWNSDRPCYAPDEDPLYKSIPFFMSSYGYGIFFDNTYNTEFRFGSDSEEHFSFHAPDGEMVYYFLYGPGYRDIIGLYTQLTGRPIMPPKWAFGFAQSRGLLTNEQLTREIADGFRERQIPCDVIYQDIGWSQELMSFTWRKANYVQPRQMLDDLYEQGFKVVVSQNPVISQRNKPQWNEADSLGFFVKDARTGGSYDMPWPWGGNSGLVDFTLPEVADWWGRLQQKPIDDGIKGYWTDMGEPAWSNEEDTDRLHMRHHAGMHDEIHNVYGLTWSKVVTSQFEKLNPNQRVFQMTRAGFAGLQRYTFGWSGDAGFGADVLNGWPSLQGQIPMALSAGLGLIPFWSTDISGYCGDINDYEAFSELYTRWMQFGVFNPLSRAHHEGNNAVEPWLFGPEVEQIAREAIELKYRLIPYTYTYARKAYDTGMPLLRAMILQFPDDSAVRDVDAQFMFGSELLVAPVVEQYAARKRIYLPAGEWIDFSDRNERYAGRQWIDYTVDLSTIPVFARVGSIIPMMPVMQYVDEDPEYPLILHVFPADDRRPVTFDVYEDDGTTNEYREDVYLKRKIRTIRQRDRHDLHITHQAENGFDGRNRAYEIRMYLDERPDRVATDDGLVRERGRRAGNRMEWYWDQDANACVIHIPAAGDDVALKIYK
jgi:alpha-glucosidase